MVTLFQCVSGGRDWVEIYIVLLHTGVGNALVFVSFILFFTIAVWNIVTSLFIEKTLAIARSDTETIMMEKRRTDLKDSRELLDLLRRLDKDGSHSISLE